MATATELKKGMYFLLNNQLVRVTKKEIVVYGTHSHSKLKIFYTDVKGSGEKFVNMKHEDKIEILDIIRKTGQVISKTDNSVQIMDMQSYETFDMKIPEELKDQVKENVTVAYWVILDDKVMKEVK